MIPQTWFCVKTLFFFFSHCDLLFLYPVFAKGDLVIKETSSNLICFDRPDLQNSMPIVNCSITPDSRLSLFQGRITQSMYIVAGVPSNVGSLLLSNFTVVNSQTLVGNNNTLSLASDVTRLVDFNITHFSSQSSISAGSNLTINLELINLGPSDSSNLVATLQIPNSFGNATSIVGFSSCVRTSDTSIVCTNNTGVKVYDPNGNTDHTFRASLNLFLPTDWSLAASPSKHFLLLL